MKTLPDTHVRAASRCPSPVTIWQTLLTRLLDQHYGLTLNDTPFADERVIDFADGAAHEPIQRPAFSA